MDRSKKITILIPCYNKSKYMPRLFASLLKQKDKNFDIVFLDDKSTDNTLDLIKQFKYQNFNTFNIAIIALEKNGGISNARNVLIDNVKTAYFWFLDPDDLLRSKSIYYFNEKLSSADYQVVTAKDQLILFGKVLLPNVLSWFGRFKRRNKQLNDLQLAWVENMSPSAWNKAFNTKWYKSLKMQFVVGRNYEDISIVNTAILSSTKMSYISKATYRYDVNLDGLTKIHNPKKFQDIFLNLSEFYVDLEKKGLLNKLQNRSNAENRLISKIMIHLFYKKQHKQTLKELDSYQEAFAVMFSFLEKYNIIPKLYSFTSARRFALNNALKNYQVIKKMYFDKKTKINPNLKSMS